MARSADGKKSQQALEDAVLKAARRWYMALAKGQSAPNTPNSAEYNRAQEQLRATTHEMLQHEGVLP